MLESLGKRMPRKSSTLEDILDKPQKNRKKKVRFITLKI